MYRQISAALRGSFARDIRDLTQDQETRGLNACEQAQFEENRMRFAILAEAWCRARRGELRMPRADEPADELKVGGAFPWLREWRRMRFQVEQRHSVPNCTLGSCVRCERVATWE
jgi:hypothetical protein